MQFALPERFSCGFQSHPRSFANNRQSAGSAGTCGLIKRNTAPMRSPNGPLQGPSSLTWSSSSIVARDSSRGGHSQLLQDPPAGHHAPYAGLEDVVAVTRRLVFARSRHSTICYNEISSRLESRSAVERVGELIAATAGAPPLLLQGNPCNSNLGDPCISNRGIEMSCILLFLAKTRSTEARWSRW